MRFQYLFLLFALVGCASNQIMTGSGSGPALERYFRDQKTREAFIASHSDLSPVIRQAILDGKLIVGMKKTTIYDLFGEPEGKYLTETDMMEIWYYDGFSAGFDKNDSLLRIFRSSERKRR